MNEIEKKTQNAMSFSDMREQANLLVKSGFLPTAIKTPEQALTIMLTGKELGIGLMESLRSINVIQGKPTMSAQLLLGLCYRTGQVEKAYVKESTSEKCVFVIQRKGNPEYVCAFTMQDARSLGLSEKDNWKKQPATMLQWRATSKACRLMFPDAICGLYTPEEIAEGVDVIENPQTGTVEVVEIHEAPKEIPAPALASSEVPTPKAEDISEDKLGEWSFPMGKYKGMPLKVVIQQTTENGKAVGMEYLSWAAEKLSNDEWRTIIQRYLKSVDVG
jgi:hypothetical protein